MLVRQKDRKACPLRNHFLLICVCLSVVFFCYLCYRGAISGFSHFNCCKGFFYVNPCNPFKSAVKIISGLIPWSKRPHLSSLLVIKHCGSLLIGRNQKLQIHYFILLNVWLLSLPPWSTEKEGLHLQESPIVGNQWDRSPGQCLPTIFLTIRGQSEDTIDVPLASFTNKQVIRIRPCFRNFVVQGSTTTLLHIGFPRRTYTQLTPFLTQGEWNQDLYLIHSHNKKTQHP